MQRVPEPAFSPFKGVGGCFDNKIFFVSNPRMQGAFNNFLKVFWASLAKPSQLTILATGLILAIFVPIIGLIAFLVSLMFVFGRGWKLANSSEFIQKVLQTSNKTEVNFQNLIDQFKQKLNEPLLLEVKEDFQKIRESLTKINQNWSNLTPDLQQQLTYLPQSIADLCARSLELGLQEQKLRRFLQLETEEKIQQEIEKLQSQIQSTQDQSSQMELQKAVELKKEQLQALETLQNMLKRTDSYTLRIQAELGNIATFLDKISLQNQNVNYLQQPILVENVKQLSQDLDIFEQEMQKVQGGL